MEHLIKIVDASLEYGLDKNSWYESLIMEEGTLIKAMRMHLKIPTYYRQLSIENRDSKRWNWNSANNNRYSNRTCRE